MHPLGQATGGKLLKGAREGRGIGQLLAQREAAQAHQARVVAQAVNQCLGRGQIEHRLGDERAGQRHPITGRASHCAPARAHVLFNTRDFQNADQLLQLRREGLPQLRFDLREQCVLNSKPDLRKTRARASIHASR
jgi:hypothetical protein